MDQQLKKLRDDYRQNILPTFYSGPLHLSLSILGALGLILFAITQIELRSHADLLFIPVAFLIANVVEYLAHRFLLHRPIKVLMVAFKEHTILHHSFFTHEAIEIESSQDFHRVLFSPYAVFFFIFIIGTPIFLTIAHFTHPSVGWISFIVGVSYYMFYEMVHTICHLHDAHWTFKIPGMRFIKSFHRSHHDPKLMRNYNFNVLIPVSDWIFGTFKR
jgi:hypothetical protein